jgi:hypothetical protein
MKTSPTFPLQLNGDKRKFCALSEAHRIYKKMNALRLLSVHVLAVTGFFAWFNTGWPTLLPEGIRALTLGLWGTCCTAIPLFAALEWICYRRRARYLAEYQAKQRGDSG